MPTLGHWEYLALMAGCVLITLPLEFVLGARVYRRFRMLVLAMLPTIVVFSIWDLVGIWRGHWSYHPDRVTGWQLPGAMPIEELVFFIVIPLCGLLTYEAVGQVLSPRPGSLLARIRRPRPSMTLVEPASASEPSRNQDRGRP